MEKARKAIQMKGNLDQNRKRGGAGKNEQLTNGTPSLPPPPSHSLKDSATKKDLNPLEPIYFFSLSLPWSLPHLALILQNLNFCTDPIRKNAWFLLYDPIWVGLGLWWDHWVCQERKHCFSWWRFRHWIFTYFCWLSQSQCFP